jgi:SAM-dependent methyltransferase
MERDQLFMEMNYTGERMVPGKADSYTFWEHIYRYRFAAPYVEGEKVLDIACGEGYGSAALLRAGAATLIGVDVSREACEHAALRYGIETRVGDATKIPLEDACVDIVVSFETIEHVARPDLFLDECVRILAPGGQVIISTPNRDSYRECAPHNPYHLKELNEEEFVALLRARFAKFQMYTQRPNSAAWWSPRILSSAHSIWWKWRGFGRARLLMQHLFCPEVVRLKTLTEARKDPVQTILSPIGALSHLANPFAIRPKSAASKEVPVYLIAVASL